MREPSPTPAAPPPVRRLLEQAYLFDDPRAYEAGVLDALDALRSAGVEGAAA
jgi:hypothetical protein